VDEASKWHVRSASLEGTFKVMPDWYIKTSTSQKSSFLSSSSSSTQEIVYVERGVTATDVENLMLTVMPDWGNVRQLMLN